MTNRTLRIICKENINTGDYDRIRRYVEKILDECEKDICKQAKRLSLISLFDIIVIYIALKAASVPAMPILKPAAIILAIVFVSGVLVSNLPTIKRAFDISWYLNKYESGITTSGEIFIDPDEHHWLPNIVGLETCTRGRMYLFGDRFVVFLPEEPASEKSAVKDANAKEEAADNFSSSVNA